MNKMIINSLRYLAYYNSPPLLFQLSYNNYDICRDYYLKGLCDNNINSLPYMIDVDNYHIKLIDDVKRLPKPLHNLGLHESVSITDNSELFEYGDINKSDTRKNYINYNLKKKMQDSRIERR